MKPVQLSIKAYIAKLFSCWILKKSWRKNVRNFFLYFSLIDYFKFKNQPFKIVSLGRDCVPRVLMTAIKLKPRKVYGEKTCPFDLCINNNFSRIAELIQNDFSDFFDDLKFNNGEWSNNDFIFIHDKNLSYKNFEKRYKNRINNFLELLKSNKKLYFIYSNFTENLPNVHDLNKLFDVIKEKRNKKPFQIVLLISNYIEGLNPRIIQIIDDIKIEDFDWVKRLMSNCQNDKYTEFKNSMEKKILKLLVCRSSIA